MEKLQVSIEPKLKKLIERNAKREGLTVSEYLRNFLEETIQ